MGLLRTAARVGVATSVHGKVQRRQSQRWSQQDRAAAAASAAAAPTPPPPPSPTAAPPAGADRITLLKDLHELLEAGVLTREEFDREKLRILA